MFSITQNRIIIAYIFKGVFIIFKICRSGRLQRRKAHDLIINMAKFGNHSHRDFRLITDADVKRVYQDNGVDFDELVERCRDGATVTFFENLIGATWMAHNDGNGVEIEVRDENGNVITRMDGPGIVSMSTYQSQFEAAIKSIKRALDNVSRDDVILAIINGVTSIETYIGYRVQVWNTANPENQIVDTKEAKISRDDKIDKWIPIMTNGIKLNKGTQAWADYKVLRAIRDNDFVHAKTAAVSAKYQDLADLVNKHRTGVAGMLFELHRVFEEPVPSRIIREMYAADANVINDEQQ